MTDERAAGRIYNVAYERTFTEDKWAQEIARSVGWKGEVIAFPSEQLPPNLRSNAFDMIQQLYSRRIRKELGYTGAVQFDEALRRTIEWERANPPEQADANDFDYDAENAALSKLRN